MFRGKKMQVREKVEKTRFTMFFQWFVAPEGRKVCLLKRRVRSHLARWEMKNCTPLWREAHFEVIVLKWNLECLPGFQNDNLRHLEWLCFDGRAKCLKPAKINIIWFTPKIVDFTFFWWHFAKKRLSKPKNDDPSRLFSLFCSSTCEPFDGHAKCMKPAKTHTNWLATLLQPQKGGSNCLYKIYLWELVICL